jgi:hypothetical protein
VLTVQGIASMTPMKVDGSGATQPISGSVAVTNLPAIQVVSGTVTANAGTGTYTVQDAADGAAGAAAPAKASYSAGVDGSGNLRGLLTDSSGRLKVILGALDLPVRTITAATDTAVADVDFLLQCDATSNAITESLPTGMTSAQTCVMCIVKTDSTANIVTVSGNGANINTASTFLLYSQGDYALVHWNGTLWRIIGALVNVHFSGGFVGVSNAAPQAEMHVASSSTNTGRGVVSEQTSAIAQGATFLAYKNRGTRSAPSAVLLNDQIALFNAAGYDGVNDLPNPGRGGALQWIASENWTSTTRGAMFEIFTTSTGAANITRRMRITGTGNTLFGTTTDNATDLVQVAGSISASAGIHVPAAANGKTGSGTLSGGTATIANTSVTANSKIFLQDTTSGALTNVGALVVSGKTAGTGFTVKSANALDTSTFDYWIVETA